MTARCGNGATAPGSKPVACTHLVGPGDPHELRRDGRADRRLVGAPVARDEREHEGAVADEDERLDDLRQLAADRLRGVACGRRSVR